MNKFQLEYIGTRDLMLLKAQINEVLQERRKKKNLEKRIGFINSLDYNEPELPAKLFDKNSSELRSIPNHWSRRLQKNSKYLPALIAQDWSHIYKSGDQENKYYVYAHVDPSKSIFVAPKEAGGNYGGTPFYIGKGTGDRAYDLKRNQGHGKRLNQILKAGFTKEQIVKIVFTGLTEQKAFEIEAKLIYYFGSFYDSSVKKKGYLLNLETPAIPEFIGQMEE